MSAQQPQDVDVSGSDGARPVDAVRAAVIQSAGLWLWFTLLLLALALVVTALVALLFKAVFPLMPGWPAGFFEGAMLGVIGLVLGGAAWQAWRLRRRGGAWVATQWLGGVEVKDNGDALWRRLLNVVDEMALASSLPVPKVFVLPSELSINALVMGRSASESTMVVTQGALNRLSRAELQGLVAYGYGCVAEGDGRLCLRVLSLVWGLCWWHGLGRAWMAPDASGHVRPWAWAAGALLAGLGGPGWITARILQAVAFRRREFRADARAMAYARSRDGLGQTLRKILHERQGHAGTITQPWADMMCFMWLHVPGSAPWLSSHPPLSERIRRLYGADRPPMATTALPEAIDSTLEPRMALVDTAFGQSGLADDPTDPVTTPQRMPARLITPPGLTPEATESLARLRRLGGPLQKRLAVLAFMVQPGNEAEARFWAQMTFGQSWAPQILADVHALPPVWRAPEFERLLSQMAYEPVSSRRDLIVALRNLMRADGRVSAADRLWWLAARHRMGEVASPQGLIRPMTGQGRDLSQLHADEQGHVAQFSAYLARMVPVPTAGSVPGDKGQQWFAGVMRRCGVKPGLMPECIPPGADELIHALAGVQELSWSMRPQLLRAWVEEALNHSPGGLMRADAADALRLAAGLLDTPLPPALSSHYPRN